MDVKAAGKRASSSAAGGSTLAATPPRRKPAKDVVTLTSSDTHNASARTVIICIIHYVGTEDNASLIKWQADVCQGASVVEGANSGRPLQQRVGDIKAQKTNGHCGCDHEF